MSNIARNIYKELGLKMSKKQYKKYCYCKCKGPNFGSCNNCGRNNDITICPAVIVSSLVIIAAIFVFIAIIVKNFSFVIKGTLISFAIFNIGYFIIGIIKYKMRDYKKFNECYSDYIKHD